VCTAPLRITCQLVFFTWLMFMLVVSDGCGMRSAAVRADPDTSAQAERERSLTVNGVPMRQVLPRQPRQPDRCLLAIRLSLFHVKVPIGMVSHSENLWRHLDEEIVAPETLSTLHRNGFRIGRAKVEDWPAVAKMLREMAGQTLIQTDHPTWPGQSVTVVLKENQDVQRIFTFTDKGRLGGLDYPPGDNILMLTCQLNMDEPSEVIVQAVPLVRSIRRINRWEKTDNGYKLSRQPVIMPVEPLEFTAKLPQGHYLVIGPGMAAMRTTSPGGRFLVSKKDGLRYETLLVVVPEVFAAPM